MAILRGIVALGQPHLGRPGARAMRILIVDDQLAVRSAVRSALENSDWIFEVVEADCGEDALAIMRKWRFDIIFSDIQLPGISGPEALAEAYKDDEAKPFMVLMSSHKGEAVREIGRNLGVYEFMPKPFRAGEVHNALAMFDRLQAPIRVLVVDDSGTARRLITRMLEKSRFQIILSEAASGEEAIEIARSAPFEVVFLDFNMSGIDGVATAEILLKQQATMQIVLMSTEQQGKTVRAAQFAGVFAFLKKPFTVNDIDVILHDAFAIKRPSLAQPTHAIFSNDGKADAHKSPPGDQAIRAANV